MSIVPITEFAMKSDLEEDSIVTSETRDSPGSQLKSGTSTSIHWSPRMYALHHDVIVEQNKYQKNIFDGTIVKYFWD